MQRIPNTLTDGFMQSAARPALAVTQEGEKKGAKGKRAPPDSQTFVLWEYEGRKYAIFTKVA